MKFLKKLSVILFTLITLIQPQLITAQDQLIDAAGFSVSTKLPDKAPAVPASELYIEVNNNNPFFTNEDITQTDPWIEFTKLDELGRVGPANAVLTTDLMPAEPRGDNSSIQPTGWQQFEWDGKYLYNRSHLIGHQLIGDGIPNLNLMTGTTTFNQEGMVPFENFVAMIVEGGETVRYRVTPYFEGDNLLASGVFMEGFSIEDNGESLSFNIYVPNRQDNISINYATGTSSATETLEQTTNHNYQAKYPGANLYYSYNRDGTLGVEAEEQVAAIVPAVPATPEEPVVEVATTSYVANANTGKFHHAHCSSVDQMSEKNKVFLDDRDTIINQGYVPCKRCNP
ncbi:DNA/RNA non-specific endonuclease [Aerococcaceae bacterium DSM 111022]|nr:DNA/RNA non-specific endonuclease [Aerococcaceae bacterium DSM 111022]